MFSSRSTKEFYVDLKDDRYYKPGETVRGDVVLDLSKPTKINQIRVVFAGTVQVGSNTLTLFSRESEVAAEPGGARQLEAKSNRFPFEVNIPAERSELPTSMKLGEKNDNVVASVRYTITASLHRPFILQALAPTDTCDISIVEPVDVSLTQYDRPVPANKEDGKAILGGTSLLVSIPKAAYVRGDIMPVMITVQGDYLFTKKNALRLILVQRIYFCGKGRREHITSANASKSLKFDVDLNLDQDFTQEILAKLYLPPSLAPTTGSSGRILRVEYSVHVSFDTNKAERGTPEWKRLFELSKALPIIIGTTPKADISIDDDDDDDEEENVNEETESEGVLQENGTEEFDADDDTTTLVNKMANVELDENHKVENGSVETAPPVTEGDTESPLEASRDVSTNGNNNPTPDPVLGVHQHVNGGPYYNDPIHEKSRADSGLSYPTIESAGKLELQSYSDLERRMTAGSHSSSTYHSDSVHDQPYHGTSPVMMPMCGGRNGGNNNDDDCTSPIARQTNQGSSRSASPNIQPPSAPYHLGQSTSTATNTSILSTSPHGGFRMPEPVLESYRTTPVADHVSVMPTPYHDAHLPPLPPRSPSSTFVQMPSAAGFPQPPSSPSSPFMQMHSVPDFPQHPQPHYDQQQLPPRSTPSPVPFHPVPAGMSEFHHHHRPVSPVPRPRSPERWAMPAPSYQHHAPHTAYPEPAPPPYWNQ